MVCFVSDFELDLNVNEAIEILDHRNRNVYLVYKFEIVLVVWIWLKLIRTM